jgi:hypothetical protein
MPISGNLFGLLQRLTGVGKSSPGGVQVAPSVRLAYAKDRFGLPLQGFQTQFTCLRIIDLVQPTTP